MLTAKSRRMPGTEILKRPEVGEFKRHDEDVVFMIDPDTDEYVQIRPDRFYDVKPGAELDVAPRTDRGGPGEGWSCEG